LADQYGFRILQDASHATGASYLGAPVGSQYSDATVFSFHAVKIVTTTEGGIITTRDRSLAHRLLKGALGDALHDLACAAGCNLRWLLRWIALFSTSILQLFTVIFGLASRELRPQTT